MLTTTRKETQDVSFPLEKLRKSFDGLVLMAVCQQEGCILEHALPLLNLSHLHFKLWPLTTVIPWYSLRKCRPLCVCALITCLETMDIVGDNGQTLFVEFETLCVFVVNVDL